ncbi:non-ribosomal peptide synthetase [Streptomyces sp. PSKA30]|uniref:non-ribosomal peptide synthetase n=1 Tax=Streptomyces sp. PSKA30 TaxID=2874597 RepID=UPI001CD1668D|nr:non-ribosomal peptide synthetase [Streptomyces sp. PSKA30]MBZ9645045.1 amino acid adenylation domain-containing protein [Streptomyces sp. PSKA30]
MSTDVTSPSGGASPSRSASALADAVLARARRTPSAVAVEDDTHLLDHAGLDRLSGRVAARLRDLGVGPGQAVAVCLPRSWRLVCVMLGIRRAGATVVPLDRLSPSDRQRHILDDSGAVAIVHDELPDVGGEFLALDADLLLRDEEPDAVRDARTDPPAKASADTGDTGTGFVFYTSGSTGRPKGVEVTDAGVLRLAEPGYIGLRPGARYACLSNPAFDALSFEVWVPLLTGGVCVILDDEQVHSPHRLAGALTDRRIDTLFITVALFNTVVERVPDCFGTVSQVLVGGEQLDARLIRRWYQANTASRTVLHNVYGPTEATTFALCHPIPRDFAGATVPLGTPLPGTRTLLRTEDGRTAEPDEIAELLLAGPALARGYRNLPMQTEQSFVMLPNPEGEAGGEERWYRTGDLVRRDTEGRVTYVGRADRQVKVRGFRIEPGEVERRVLAHPAVRQAYVCTRRDEAGRNELLAFVVPGGDPGDLSFDAYDRHLTTGLPPYMRPHHTHLVPELPLTPNGKVDRDALLRDAPAPWRRSYEGEARVSDEQRPVLDLAEDILGVAGLRPDDRWIPHGGDSLKALRFRFEVMRRFHVDLPQSLVLTADFAALAEAVHAQDAATGEHPPVPAASGEPTAPATREQERLWFLHQRDPEDRAYDVPLVFRLRGGVDRAALRRAVRGLVERHTALRTRLVPTPHGLRQRAGDPYDPWEPLDGGEALDSRDLDGGEGLNSRDLDGGAGEGWRDLADRFFDHRFDLTDTRMLRAAWVGGPDAGVLLLHLHHVAVDGWSLNLLFRDLGDAYSAALRGESGGPGTASAFTPLDFARWQREWQASAAYGRRRARLGERYGRDGELSPVLPASEAVAVRPRARLLRTSLDLVRRAALDRLAAERGLTRFQLLVSAFAASVYGVTGQERPLVASPVSGRSRPEFADAVGMFANTVLLELELRPRDGLAAQLASHADTVRDVLEDQEVALADLLSDPVLRERTPLFDYLFVLENTDFSALRLDGCEVRPVWPEPLGAKCALTLSVVEHESGFDCLWEYRDDLGAERAEAAARLFRRCLDHLTGGDDVTLRELIADHRRGLPDTGRGEALVPDFPTVADGFARQVAATPHAPALTDGGTTLTYAELDARAHALATDLRARHPLPADPAAPASVALYLQPSVEHIVALLAAARLGVTVVPLDPAYPSALLRHVLDQADPLCVLVTRRDLGVLETLAPPSLPRHVVTLTDTPADMSAGTPAAVPVPYAHEGLRPLYTLFTSGSTGVPKGVQVPDRTLCNLLTWQRVAGGLDRPARTQQFSMLSFDVSFQEIFTTLCSGGLLHLVDPGWRHDAPALLEQLESAAVERVFLPYVALQLLAEHGVRTGRYPSRLREVVTAGEQLVCTDAIRRWFAGLPGARLFNHYGPTETHVVSALCLEGDPAGWPLRPAIGRPVAGAVLRVVDGSGLPVAPGATGALLIGGPMAGRCYLGDQAAHRERFTDDPELGVLYRTGDLARFDARGLLHYAGRDDAQIKLAGHRLELGQVEAALLQYPGVVNAVAAVADGRLVAALECRGEDPDLAGLAEHLSALLPAHVRVARFRRVTALPRTPSGKLDRRATLTAPGHDLRQGEPAAADLSPLEERLTALFEDVTGTPVGVRQRYFDAGATSLDLMRFQLACAGEDGLSFSVPDLFEHVTLRALAGFLEGRRGGEDAAAHVAVRPDGKAGGALPDRDSGAIRPGRDADVVRPAPDTGMVRPAPEAADEPVAVIGMAVRLPGAPDLAAFWDLVTSGRRGIEHFPAADGRVGARSQMEGLLAFDAGRFTLSPGEARLMDPQQRHLLMSCVEALAHAGVGDPAGRRVGLIAACGENTYFQNMLREGDPDALPDAFRLALHHEKDFLATKAAYHLGLTGPAFTVQSACSSSLVGVHLAAGLLRQGDAEVMLVGGVLVDTELTGGYTYRPQHIFSPDGHCRPFSADAAGTVGASGTGVVVLKPLAAARRDGDTVYAVVTGSGINNDGSDKLSYSAPARSGQRAAIRAALRRSGRTGTDLGYVEAHGTGTALGDPVEAAALRDAYGLADDAGVALSSVKSQIGHLGAAAGVVGMVRAVLAVHHGVVPPTADFDRLNPEIDAGPFRVPVTAESWPRDVPRVAAVSSFGIGGTNAHLLLEHPADRPSGPAPGTATPAATPATAPAAVPCVVLSASSEAALRADGRRIADYLDAHPAAYPQVLRHLQAGRPALGHRAAAACPDAASASAWLRAPAPVAAPVAVQAAREEVPVRSGDPRQLAEAWTAGRTVAWPEGPACAPWDFPPPALDLSEYDFPRIPGRAAPASASPPVPEDAGPPSRRLPADQWLHQPQWTRLRRARTGVPSGPGTAIGAAPGAVNVPGTPTDGPAESRTARRTALVVTADIGGDIGGDIGADTWRFLEDHYARVVRVRPATALGRLADDRYEVAPGDAAQLVALLTLVGDDAARTDGGADGIDWLHALPLALDGRVDERALEHAQRVCLDAVAALSKALADLPDASRPRVWLLSHRAQPVTGAVATPLAGLLAAGIETPRQELGVVPRWIDLPGPDPADWAPYLPELLRDDTLAPRVVALRDGYWWHRPVQPVPTPAFPSTADRVAEPGTHLILGGTGGIGVTLAARLLADPANRVVLVARGTEVPARLRPYGDRVTLVGADLAAEDLDAIADRLAPHLDGLAGVVHAAGTAAGGLLAGRVAATARRATAAKLRGALLVERLAVRHTPAYVAYCSSMAAHHGGVGQFDYAAANACLDAFAHHTPPAGGGATVRLSIGWDIWGEVGMARQALAGDTRHQEHLKVALTPEDGAAVFAHALSLRLPHLMVSTTPLPQAQFFYEATPAAHRTRSGEDATENAREVAAEGALSGEPAAGLTEVLCELLGVDTVDPDAPLYDLGADSLTLLELLAEVKRRHGTDIDLAALGHHVTLTEILGKLGGGARQPAQSGAEAEVEVWQRGTGEDVLCLVHPVGGDIQAYRPLVSALPGELTVCLIPDPALRDPRLPARSIADRAADYLRAVRAAFPDAGPRLRLAGWSFGAWTALSMAALAERDGRPAAGLYLLDPPPPGAGTEFAAYDKAQVDEVFARELGGSRADGLTDPGRAYAERLARCCRANLAAMAEHRLPRITTTPTTVWLAERPVDTPVLAPRPTPPGAWDAHLPRTSRVRRVDADHYGLVAAPHARDVAAVLAAGPRPSTRQP